MKKLIFALTVVLAAACCHSDGGAISKKRTSRFVAAKDSIAPNFPADSMVYLPKEAVSKNLMLMDAQIYKMYDLSFMVPVKGVTKPASDYTKVMVKAVAFSDDTPADFFKMQLDFFNQGQREELEKVFKSQYSTGKEETYTSIRKFMKHEALKSKAFPGAEGFMQKWETTDEDAKQEWIDCSLMINGENGAVAIWVLAAPDMQTAEKIISEFTSNFLKKLDKPRESGKSSKKKKKR